MSGLRNKQSLLYTKVLETGCHMRPCGKDTGVDRRQKTELGEGQGPASVRICTGKARQGWVYSIGLAGLNT